MKARITTVISLVGVLGAGSAAALVNTQVLQSTESKSNEQVMVGSADDNSSTATPEVIATGDKVSDDKFADGTATKIQSSVLTSTQAMYQIGDAGLVTLDTAGDTLTVVSVTPNSGWTVIKVENYGSADVEVKLQSGNTVVEFKANLQLGIITTSVESKILGDGTIPGLGSTPGGGTVDDDDDDDSYEDEDDDDDDEDDDDDVSVTIEFEDDDDDYGDDDD